MPGGGLPTSIKRVWTPAADLAYARIGWRPEGTVYYDYEVNSTTGGGCPDLDCFTATAYGDADGNTFRYCRVEEMAVRIMRFYV